MGERSNLLSNSEKPQSFIGMPLIPLSEIYEGFPLPYQLDLPSDVSTTSRIASLLSAASYPMGPTYVPNKRTSLSNEIELHHGLLPLTNPRDEHSIIRSIACNGSENKTVHTGAGKTKSREDTTSPRSTKQSGIPQAPALALHSEEISDNRDRRRKQVRMAQRVYRSRQIERVVSLEKKIEQLETKVQELGCTAISLYNKLLLSKHLFRDCSLVDQLYDLILASFNLVNTSNGPPDNPDGLPSLQKGKSTSEQPSGTPRLETPGFSPETIRFDHDKLIQPGRDITPRQIPSPSIPRQINPLELSGEPFIPLPLFIEQLHMTVIYQGYLTLSNPAIDFDYIYHRFRFLLQVVTRDRLAVFFESALHARMSKRQLRGFEDVPFFSLGGAGTHRIKDTGENQEMAIYASQYHEPCTMIKNPLASFSSHTGIEKEFEGEWFDMQDLEEFLRSKDVKMIKFPAISNRESSMKGVIGVARLIKQLISNSVCLGRSPGFRRCDVEKAFLSLQT